MMKRAGILVSAAGAALVVGAVLLVANQTRAIQSPTLKLDMVMTGNTYDGATNSMTVGTIDKCVNDPSTAFPHVRQAHLIVQTVEDLAGVQVRINHDDARLEVTGLNWAPFQDPNTLAPVGFLNLPIDQTTLDHRGLTGASDFSGVNTSLASQSYLADQTFGISPDTPAKQPSDGNTSYSAPSGGILATVVMQVKAGANGNASNFLNLDDSQPNAPGSSVDIYTGTGINKVNLTNAELGDGYVGSATTCVVPACDPDCPGAVGSPTSTPTGGAIGYYHPVAPCRILDTRSSPQGVPAGKVGQNSEITADVTGSCGVPSMGVSAVVVNTTVTEPTANSFLTVFPTGVTRPTASNLNFVAEQTVPNLVTVKVGGDGNVKAYNAVGQVHVIFDVVGWYGGETGGSRFNALPPARILDTRTNPQGVPPGPVDEGETITVDVTGVGAVPPSDVTAVVLNATVTGPTKGSFLTLFPSDATQPLASNLNFTAGETIPNLVAVKVGADGNVKVYNALGSVHVIFDVVGWYGATGDLFYPLTPCRNWDTRLGEPAPGPKGKIGSASSVTVDVTGICAVPASGASAVIVNATVSAPTAPSYLTVYPSDPKPFASNLNFGPGQTVPNLVVVKIGADGNIRAYNEAGETHALFDVVGYFAP